MEKGQIKRGHGAESELPPAIVELQAANIAPARAARVVSDIQAGLGALGYASGPVDGVMGPRTAEAIRQYQMRHEIPVDGRASRELVRHIEAQGSLDEGG